MDLDENPKSLAKGILDLTKSIGGLKGEYIPIKMSSLSHWDMDSDSDEDWSKLLMLLYQ